MTTPQIDVKNLSEEKLYRYLVESIKEELIQDIQVLGLQYKPKLPQQEVFTDELIRRDAEARNIPIKQAKREFQSLESELVDRTEQAYLQAHEELAKTLTKALSNERGIA